MRNRVRVLAALSAFLLAGLIGTQAANAGRTWDWKIPCDKQSGKMC